jgi:hypothetical protein
MKLWYVAVEVDVVSFGSEKRMQELDACLA